MNRKILAWVETNAKWFQALSLVGFSFLLAVAMNISWGEIPANAELGRIARQDIRADKDYDILDEEATNRLKDDALVSVLPIFDWDESVSPDKIIENPSDLAPWKDRGILIRRVQAADHPKLLLKDLSVISSLEGARDQAVQRLREFRPSNRSVSAYGPPLPEDVKPSLFFNDEETKIAQDKALADVKPVIIKVQAGESIIRSGDRFEASHFKIIEGIRKEKTKRFGWTRILGTFLFIALFCAVLFFILSMSARKIRLHPKDYFLIGIQLLLVVAVERLFLFVCGAVRGLLPVEIPLSSFYGLVPIAFGSMMVRLVLPLPVALLFAPLGAALAGFFLQGSLNYTLYYLLSSVLGLQMMAGVRSRWHILRAGFELGAFNAMVLLALDMVNVTSVTGVVSLEDSGMRIALAFLGGFLSSVLVMIFLPLFESGFNYLTPIKLLEYGSLNHPLLREMIVRAPGTYHHSHMVGTLAESACDAIGADSLFARVASYFHDIGKMKKAGYFIENQSAAGGEDRHANLVPSMSALIIASHVKDGMDLAQEYKLPKRIADIIPQHQGTKLISYFFNKAKQGEDKDLHVASERDYRYPGPKPQTREAGVILLADTIEAATRALKDRNPARIEEVVRNMINKNFIDGQLDECELTLKDLHTIANSFIRILMGVYHQRIEYPPDQQEKLAKELGSGTSNADKYAPATPLREDSLKEASKLTSTNITRIGPK